MTSLKEKFCFPDLFLPFQLHPILPFLLFLLLLLPALITSWAITREVVQLLGDEECCMCSRKFSLIGFL